MPPAEMRPTSSLRSIVTTPEWISSKRFPVHPLTSAPPGCISRCTLMRLGRTAAPVILIAIGWVSAFSVPAQALSVCADPDYLPYSNRAGEGFENRIAEAVAKALGESVEYTWGSYRGHGGFPQFLSSTLDAKKCDVVMDIPYGSREELTTRPYYVSSYVFVFDRNKHFDITSMNSPALKKLKVGFERDTPAEEALKMRGMVPGAVAFDVGEDNTESPETMLAALKKGQIDVLITWQPAISAFLRAYPELEVVAVPNERALGPPEQYSFPMSMGVRTGDQPLKARLDEVIEKHQAELAAILRERGVVLYAPRQESR
ncbi:MAG: quinoprotein dehydrogenase-associated putative ABC transporter substrate-binding protein [Terriglobia bacterium]|nr:MAG: quinoprotein dehydrogenase-associated putative ABC transporter substrate-binding protein [Terriglobia bacterium]